MTRLLLSTLPIAREHYALWHPVVKGGHAFAPRRRARKQPGPAPVRARAHVLKRTEEGTALYERTSVLLGEIDEAAGAIAQGGASPRGRLRISAPLLFSQAAMGKLAAGFALRYPDVRLEVTTGDRPVGMVEEGYDLVIRVNPAPDANLIGRVFLPDRLLVVAPPGETSTAPAVICGTRSERVAWNVLTPAGKATIGVEPVLCLASLLMVRDAIRLGVGAAQLPLSLVTHDLASGTLVSCGDRLLSVRVSAFLGYLKEGFPLGTPEELAACL